MRAIIKVLILTLARWLCPHTACAQNIIFTPPIKAAESAAKGTAETLKGSVTEAAKLPLSAVAVTSRAPLGGQSDNVRPIDLSKESFENLRAFRKQALDNIERRERLDALEQRLQRAETPERNRRDPGRSEFRGYATEREERERLEQQRRGQERRDSEARQRRAEEGRQRESEARRPKPRH